MTFDFWGTLVDVDKSGRIGMAKVLAELGLAHLDAAQLYDEWDVETVRQYRSTTWRPYLSSSEAGLRMTIESLLDPDQAKSIDWASATYTLVSTMTGEAEPHPDTEMAIAFLKARFPLMPITNMDTALFRLNPFGRTFDEIVTAEDAGAFKPQERIFRHALDRLGLAPEDVLHVSLSQVHDIEGVKPLGFACAWINRNHEPLGRLTPRPDYEFSDLRGLVDFMQRESIR